MRYLLILYVLIPGVIYAQSIFDKLQSLQSQRQSIESQLESIDQKIESLKLEKVREDLKTIGLPSNNYIEHSAMILEYSEENEQAKWVTHVITPDIINGRVGRTNDFRPDPKVPTGTAVEADYFLKELQSDSSYVYDGFGYDRGHLAPSADFRWSHTALSESYYYSNMSPQKAAFNREKWGEVEALLRGYIYRHESHQLYVITLPVLEDDLPIIERSINKVSIPRSFIKVALDLEAKKGIAIHMPNDRLQYPIPHFALTIDEAEQLTGYNFFNKLELTLQEQLESKLDKEHWFPEVAQGDVTPLYPPDLPSGHFNTIQAKLYEKDNETINVCGKVVSGRTTRKGNVMLNLDQKYPNAIFSVFIPKDHIINFPFDPVNTLVGDHYCFKGKIDGFMGHPSMRVESDQVVKRYRDEQMK